MGNVSNNSIEFRIGCISGKELGYCDSCNNFVSFDTQLKLNRQHTPSWRILSHPHPRSIALDQPDSTNGFLAPGLVFFGAAAHISRIVSNHSLRFGRYLKIPPYPEICFAMPTLGAGYSDFPSSFGGNIWSLWMSKQSVQRRNQIFNIFPVQFSHKTIINITLRFRSLWVLYDTVEVFRLPCSRARNSDPEGRKTTPQLALVDRQISIYLGMRKISCMF